MYWKQQENIDNTRQMIGNTRQMIGNIRQMIDNTRQMIDKIRKNNTATIAITTRQLVRMVVFLWMRRVLCACDKQIIYNAYCNAVTQNCRTNSKDWHIWCPLYQIQRAESCSPKASCISCVRGAFIRIRLQFPILHSIENRSIQMLEDIRAAFEASLQITAYIRMNMDVYMVAFLWTTYRRRRANSVPFKR